jgi:hypothetical protein
MLLRILSSSSRQEASVFFESPSADMHFTHTYIDLYTSVVTSSVYLFQQRTPATNPSYFISDYLHEFHFFGPPFGCILAAFTPTRFYRRSPVFQRLPR